MKVARVVLSALLFSLVQPSIASAHGLRTAYLEVVEIAQGRATVHLRVTGNDPSLVLTAAPGCTLGAAGDGGSSYDRAFRLECLGTLAESWIELRGLGPIVSEAVAYASFEDGTSASSVLTPSAPRLSLRRAEAPSAVALQYARLGVGHILAGYDHLLFLLLLTLLVRDVRGVLVAESAFTLSHGLSFSATALGWIHVSSVAAEACIGLSLVFLAAEIDPARPASKGRAAVLALTFGLVHGLGFAAGLRDIGLPERAVGVALVSFGGGVEIGQIAFLAALFAAYSIGRRAGLLEVRGPRVTLRRGAAPWVEVALVYGAGSVSAYWLLARGLACLARP